MKRIECIRCGKVSWLQPNFAPERSRHIKAFARYALDLLRCMNIKDVANHLRVSWTFIKDLQWDSADIPEKRAILEILHLNYSFDGASLCYETRKPFDILSKGFHSKFGSERRT